MKPFIIVIYVIFAPESNMEKIAYTTHYKFSSKEICELFSGMLTNELARFNVDVVTYCEQMEGVGN